MGDLPRQAVILAGGRGERLRPLTDALPKALVRVNGRPFLDYLLEELSRNGFEEALLLLGYLPDAVKSHYGESGPGGIRLRYSVTPEEYDTGSRMRSAAPMMDDLFVLMYCDNYWPLRMARLRHAFARSGAPAQITVYRNRDGYTRDNVAVGLDGRVTRYDRGRTAGGLAGVDIGFALLRKEVLSLLPAGGDAHFEDEVYGRLVDTGDLTAFVTEHRYYSVGSPERLPVTERFFAGRSRTVVLDRDGVLNEKAPPARYVSSPGEFRWLPGAVEALARLKAAGMTVVVVSNQAGVARGALTPEDLAAVDVAMRAQAEEHGGGIDAAYYCPHGWDEGCECRKPRPGLLFQAQRDLDLDLTTTFFIGDDPRDLAAGAEAGCRTLLVREGRQLLELVEQEVLGTYRASA